MTKQRDARDSHWVFDGQIFSPEPEHVLKGHHVGFVYEIEHNPTGRKYIGKKQMLTRVKLKPLKGRKRPRYKMKETDWRTYTSSCDAINKIIQRDGHTRAFVFRILKFCGRKSELNYHEARLQFERRVLHDPDYFNGMINCRISRIQLGIRHASPDSP